jgi:type IV pilus assembly protein PilN
LIRINLLTAERKVAKKKGGLPVGQKLTIGCSLLLVSALTFIGWRYWSITHDSAQLDRDIAAAQQETVRLHGVIQQVQQFEQRRAQLQQRVLLIEQLRKGQTGPVHMLDQISRSLPPMLWLTELKQNDKVPGEVQIDGQCTTLTGLSDFVASLEASGYFKRSVEIVSTQSDPLPQPPGELIKFSLRAQFQTPSDAKAAPAAPQTPGAAPMPPVAKTSG